METCSRENTANGLERSVANHERTGTAKAKRKVQASRGNRRIAQRGGPDTILGARLGQGPDVMAYNFYENVKLSLSAARDELFGGGHGKWRQKGGEIRQRENGLPNGPRASDEKQETFENVIA